MATVLFTDGHWVSLPMQERVKKHDMFPWPKGVDSVVFMEQDYHEKVTETGLYDLDQDGSILNMYGHHAPYREGCIAMQTILKAIELRNEQKRTES